MRDESTVQIGTWETPATWYPLRRVGNHRIHREWQPEGHYAMSGLDDKALYEVTKRIPVTSLQEKRDGRWHTWMVDDPPHWKVMQWFANQAHGRVLTAGLGLGLVHHALAENEKVSSVWAVDKSWDVARLLMDQIPLINIKEQDFGTFVEETSQHFDWIIVDLWVANGYEEKMALLPEVIDLRVKLDHRWPDATKVFHGYPSCSDVTWPISDRTREVMMAVAEAREMEGD